MQYILMYYFSSQGLWDPQKWIGSVHDNPEGGVSPLTLEHHTKKMSYDRTCEILKFYFLYL